MADPQRNATGRTDPVVGIDLGTTNSLVAIADERGPRVLAPEGESPLVPSVVRYHDDGSVTVGSEARAGAIAHPRTTMASAKRLMGRSVSDAAGDLPYMSVELVAGEHDTARIRLPLAGGERIVSPQEVAAEVLKALRSRAEAVLGTKVERAVVTVPAYFDDAQRQATRDAGRIAGLDVVRIVNEPTAAALAYGIGTGDRASDEPQHVAVYDLGGGTFDISILRLTPAEQDADNASNPDYFQVLATAGDTRLGGDDVDHMLIALFTREIYELLGVEREGGDADPSSFPPETRRALKQFAEGVKHELSERDAASVRIDLGQGRVYERTITRDEFDAMIEPWARKTLDACARAMRDAKRSLGGMPLDAVVLVGGSTRVPLVRRVVGEFFGIEPYTALDPDRVVAMGAAVQAGVLGGTSSGSLLLDVIPLSLGIETAGGAVAKVIMRNSPVPARATEMFSTQVDGQVSIKLNVVQGEREMAGDCRSLGVFELSGIPPMPAGVPQVEVDFLVDANGVLRVSARERRSGKRAQLQIVPNHGLTRDEVDAMEAASLEHARDDMQQHRIVDLIANGKLDLKWIGERLEKHGDALDPAYRDALRAQLATLESMIMQAEADWRSVDANAMHAAKQSLDEASVRLQEVSIAASLREDG